MKTEKSLTPDEKIDGSTCFLGATLGGIAGIILAPFCVVQTNNGLPPMIGMLAGLVVAWVVIRLRKRHASAAGIWKRFNEFMLTQMDFDSAFKRKK